MSIFKTDQSNGHTIDRSNEPMLALAKRMFTSTRLCEAPGRLASTDVER